MYGFLLDGSIPGNIIDSTEMASHRWNRCCDDVAVLDDFVCQGAPETGRFSLDLLGPQV